MKFFKNLFEQRKTIEPSGAEKHTVAEDNPLQSYIEKHPDLRGEIIEALIQEDEARLIDKFYRLESLLRGREEDAQWLGAIGRSVKGLLESYKNKQNFVFYFNDGALRIVVRLSPDQQNLPILELVSNVMLIHKENWVKNFPD